MPPCCPEYGRGGGDDRHSSVDEPRPAKKSIIATLYTHSAASRTASAACDIGPVKGRSLLQRKLVPSRLVPSRLHVISSQGSAPPPPEQLVPSRLTSHPPAGAFSAYFSSPCWSLLGLLLIPLLVPSRLTSPHAAASGRCVRSDAQCAPVMRAAD